MPQPLWTVRGTPRLLFPVEAEAPCRRSTDRPRPSACCFLPLPPRSKPRPSIPPADRPAPTPRARRVSAHVAFTGWHSRTASNPCRPASTGEAWGGNSSPPSLGHVVDAWIDWQVWAFQELGHLPEQPDDFDALTRAACVRRSWEAATSVWFREGRNEATDGAYCSVKPRTDATSGT